MSTALPDALGLLDAFRALPYPLPVATTECDPWHDLAAKTLLLRDVAAIVDPHGTIAEIGVWRGTGLIAMLAGAPNAARLIAVDDESREADSQHMAAWNIAAWLGSVGRLPGPLTRYYGRADDVPLHQSIELVHIDAGHEYIECLDDLLFADGRGAKLIIVDDIASLSAVRRAVEVFSRVYDREWLEVTHHRGAGIFGGDRHSRLLREVAARLGAQWQRRWHRP